MPRRTRRSRAGSRKRSCGKKRAHRECALGRSKPESILRQVDRLPRARVRDRRMASSPLRRRPEYDVFAESTAREDRMSSAWWNLTVVGVALATFAAAQDCRVLQLAASDGQTYDRFGWGLSFDGHRSAIGAPGRNRVYVYELGQDSWSAPSLLRPYDGDRDVYWFGVSTAVHGDTVLVGSAGNGFHHFLGAVSVFERDATGAWNEVQRLRAQGTGENDSFGSTIAASDGWLFVGAPDRLFSQDQQGIVFVWRRTEGGWNPRGELHPEPSLEYQQFGRSVSSTDRLLLVGASAESSNGVPNNGAAYLFERVGTTWVRAARVVPSDADAYARVGYVVSLSRGSDRAIVGAREAAYI